MFWKTMIYRTTDMNFNLEPFNSWIKSHKLFALSAPFVVLLMVYFLTHSIGSLGQEDQSVEGENAYNNTLPNQDNELKVQKPNDLYKKSQQDSLEGLRGNSHINSIIDSKRGNDSLERIWEELNTFSFDGTGTRLDEEKTITTEARLNNLSPYAVKTSEAKEKLEYRKMLIEARDERLSRSQDYTATYAKEQFETPSEANIRFSALVYRDQFILPGNRVTLILDEDVYHKGNYFPKNTFIYATCNIQGARVLLEITNINSIALSLEAIDKQDGMVGLYNVRAGELLEEFKRDIQSQGTNELSEVAHQVTDVALAKNLVQSFGNYFKKKKYNQRDKILLVNGDRLFLVSKK